MASDRLEKMRQAQQRSQPQQGEPAAVAEPSPRKLTVVPPAPKPEKAVSVPAKPPKNKPPKPPKAKAAEPVQRPVKPPPEHPPRLPDGSTFTVRYDATAVMWSGTLGVPLNGRTLVFEEQASGVFRVLRLLDEQWRKSDAGRIFDAAAMAKRAEEKSRADTGSVVAVEGEPGPRSAGRPSDDSAGGCARDSS